MLGAFLRNALTGPWIVRRYFPRDALREVELAVKQSEARHAGQLRVVIEGHLDPWEVFAHLSAGEKAVSHFAQLGVWDTEHNNGVLLYLLLSEKKIEIVADRGINNKVTPETWQHICRDMSCSFKDGNYLTGLLETIEAISDVLEKHFPDTGSEKNELPDFPLVIS